MHSPHHPGSDHARRLLARLDRIGDVLRERGDALALLGLGSVGRDLHRLDEHSDLDFFAVVEDGAKVRYLESLDWLEAAAPVAFSFPNTPDGRKLLFDDGLYAEYAVFTLAELRAAAYPPARVVWRRADAPDDLDVPTTSPDAGPIDVGHAVNEAMTNLFVGLHRDERGETLSAMRLIQVHAVDRILEVAGSITATGTARQDLFAAERGVELRYPSRELPLEVMVAGYRRNGPAARAVLAWLQSHCPEHVDPALLAVVEPLVRTAEQRAGELEETDRAER